MDMPAPAELSPADALLAAFAGATGVAGCFAAAGYARQSVVAPIDALVAQLTPGSIGSSLNGATGWVTQTVSADR